MKEQRQLNFFLLLNCVLIAAIVQLFWKRPTEMRRSES